MAIFQFLLPDIGEGTAEGEIVKWHVKEGDLITEDQPMVEVMTDKATVVIPSPKNGTIVKRYGKEGDIIPVHQPVVDIELNGFEVRSEDQVEYKTTPPPSTSLFEFLLPDIGEGTAEGEVVKWYIQVGDVIGEDDPMVEVMTDKATVVLPSPKAGKVVKLHAAVGEIAQVHKPLVTIEILAANGTVSEKERSVETVVPEKKSLENKKPKSTHPVDVLATPGTRRLARSMNVDLTAVSGSGKNGRITSEDVRAAANSTVHPSVSSKVEAESTDHLIEEIPFAGIRRKIAERMVQSKFTAPHFSYMDEVDITELVTIRNRLKTDAEKEGIKLTYMAFMLKALAESLKKHPILNATLDEKRNVIQIRKFFNIGIGMDTPTGLIVPVIKNVERKSIFILAKELQDLADRTKKGQVKADELKDGTFTISNVGAIGGLMATPVINFPEVAIMAPGKIQERPVVINGEIKVRWMMYHSWSCDHRIVDGADAVRCGNTFAEFLSRPELLLVHLR